MTNTGTTTAPVPFQDPLVQAINHRSQINGKDYAVRIGLPKSYLAGQERYPILVVLDADISFGTAYEAAVLEAMWSRRPNATSAPIPEMIVVGISFPDASANPVRRNYEYMPEAAGDVPLSPALADYIELINTMAGVEYRTGGAPVFLQILREEILPAVDDHYRTDSSRKMLFGQSAGGAFCCFTLLTEPTTFTDYVIVSPGLPDGAVFQLEAAWAANHKDLPAGVFLTAGEQEIGDLFSIFSNTALLAERLQSRAYPNLRLKTWFMHKAGHMETAAPSIARGLIELLG